MTEKKLFKIDGLELGMDYVDASGRFYRILTHSTIVSDHIFDTSELEGWIPEKGSRWVQVTGDEDFEVRSMSDGRIRLVRPCDSPSSERQG